MVEKTEIGNEGGLTNGAEGSLKHSHPYVVQFQLRGVSDIILHRWNVEGVEAKANAAKGSAAKKSDNLESYVYRNEAGEIAIPGEYVRMSMVNAAKFRQDPRSPRKSAMDLYKAGIISLTPLASFGPQTVINGTPGWDYEHKARVQVQRAGITRTRPAIKAGWTLDYEFLVNLPEYIPLADFHDVLINAGRLVGLADFRPTYGRFSVAHIQIQAP